MIDEMQGKRITVVVPKKEIKRVRKIKKDGPKTSPKDVWLIDFRGIRSSNCTNKRRKKRPKYSGQKSAFNSPIKLQEAVDE